MSDKLFHRLLVLVTIVGVISLLALMAVTLDRFAHVSLISYIANGR